MNIKECTENTRVVYNNGAKTYLIEKCGVVVKAYDDDDGIVLVKFDDLDDVYPIACFCLRHEIPSEILIINSLVKELQEKIDIARKRIESLQKECPHPKSLVTVEPCECLNCYKKFEETK